MAIRNLTNDVSLLFLSKSVVLQRITQINSVIYGSVARKYYSLSEDQITTLDDPRILWSKKIHFWHKVFDMEATDDIDFLILEKDKFYINTLATEIQGVLNQQYKMNVRIIRAIHAGTTRIRVNGHTIADFTIKPVGLIQQLRKASSCGCFSCLIPPISFLTLNLWCFLNRPWVVAPLNPMGSNVSGFNFQKTVQALKWIYFEQNEMTLKEIPVERKIFQLSYEKLNERIYGGEIAVFYLLALIGVPDYQIEKTNVGLQLSGSSIYEWTSFCSTSTGTNIDIIDINEFIYPETLPSFLITNEGNEYFPTNHETINFLMLDDIKVFSWNMILFEAMVLYIENRISYQTYLRLLFWHQIFLKEHPEYLFSFFSIPNMVVTNNLIQIMPKNKKKDLTG